MIARTLVVLTLASSSVAFGQLPERPTNLEVLPDSLTTEQVVAIMRGFTQALGVRCTYCHVGREGAPLDSFDFASDDVHEKEMARGMMRMVEEINEDLLLEILDHHASTVRVQCVTCHRGAARPVMLEDTLAVVVERAGADSMLAVYSALRERHYGRFTYDFGERPLSALAARLVAEGKLTEARAALELNAMQFPQSAAVAYELGRVYEALGQTERAIEQYRRALELQPEHRGALGRLQELTGGT